MVLAAEVSGNGNAKVYAVRGLTPAPPPYEQWPPRNWIAFLIVYVERLNFCLDTGANNALDFEVYQRGAGLFLQLANAGGRAGHRIILLPIVNFLWIRRTQ